MAWALVPTLWPEWPHICLSYHHLGSLAWFQLYFVLPPLSWVCPLSGYGRPADIVLLVLLDVSSELTTNTMSLYSRLYHIGLQKKHTRFFAKVPVSRTKILMSSRGLFLFDYFFECLRKTHHCENNIRVLRQNKTWSVMLTHFEAKASRASVWKAFFTFRFPECVRTLNEVEWN